MHTTYSLSNSIGVSNGQHLHLKVQPTIFASEPDVKTGFPVETRGCRYPDEVVTKEEEDEFGGLFLGYSSLSCEFACIAKTSFEFFGCLPPFMPSPVRSYVQYLPCRYKNISSKSLIMISLVQVHSILIDLLPVQGAYST